MDTESGVVFGGLGEPSREIFKNGTTPWETFKTYHAQKVSWSDAVSQCQTEGKVASFTSQAEVNRIKVYYTKYLWLGAR